MGTTMVTDTFFEALDGVAWNELEVAHRGSPVADIPLTLRRLATAGAQAKEEDCNPLYSLVTREGQDTPSAAAAALPFMIALASDPALGARLTLLELLVAMQAPALSGDDWTGAWALLADPEPAVRRAALPLAAGTARLLERWRAETDQTVRIPLLLALGDAVSGEAALGGSGDAAVEDARAVLTEVLAGDDPVLWVAAVLASARFDHELAAAQLDRLVEVLSDRTSGPRFEEVWYTPDVEGPWTRAELVWPVIRAFEHDPATRLSFTVRLLRAAHDAGDAALGREALDVAWRLLTGRRGAEGALLPVAGALLDQPDGAVRLRAVNILGALGPAAAPYADRLAALLDDDAADEFLDGTVGELARWALTRIGDPRALPGLIDRLRAQAEEETRCSVVGDPRRPDVADVLVPLRAHADVLLPAIRAVLRQDGAHGGMTGALIEVLGSWGEDALPALPELLPLLADTVTSLLVVRVLEALGPAAASAEPALNTCQVLDHPANHAAVAAAAARIGHDRAAALRSIGEAVLAADEPGYGPIAVLGDFGPDAAPYADRVRTAMENTTHWPRLTAAVTLWSITGSTEPSLGVLEEFIVPIADGDDSFFFFREALHAVVRMGRISPAIRTALSTIRRSDRRLCADGGYPMILRDEELRSLIDQALASPASHPEAAPRPEAGRTPPGLAETP